MHKYNRYLKLEVELGQSIFLWGARKTGKSTFLKNSFSDSIYIDLLKTDLFFRYSKQPSLLREEILALSEDQIKLPIIIDEVQKVPSLLDEIHWLIENTEATFILCGSSSRRLKKEGTNLLGGRAIKYNFYPLIYPEYKDEFDLLKILNQGLIPSHFISKNPRKLLQSYIEDYLTNEIRAEGYVRNITAFSRFLDSTRFSCGEMLNYTNIAREVGIDSKTIKEYYQILVDTLVGYLIYPYAKKVSRSIISHAPKFYYFDVGIATRLSKKTFTELTGADAGKSLENYILMELVAYIGLNDSDYNLFYWRTNNGFEVDFILSDGISKPIAIEVKISKNLHKTELKPMKAFMEEHKLSTAYVVCLESKSRKLLIGDDREILVLPVEEFLKKLWLKEIFDK
jgi:uncharacterized protein